MGHSESLGHSLDLKLTDGTRGVRNPQGFQTRWEEQRGVAADSLNRRINCKMFKIASTASMEIEKDSFESFIISAAALHSFGLSQLFPTLSILLY